jgi:formylglycine-generating enzyme required for sulfatase activity
MKTGIPLCLLVMSMSIVLAAAGPGRPPAGPAQGKVITNSIGMKLALIPAGRFKMGSPASERERESEETQHEVAITRPFHMGVYEVTQGQYEKVMGKNPSFFGPANGGSPEHPVDQVMWGDAVEFCRKLSDLPEERAAGRAYRLPTEAEWEYACRAGTSTTFHFGNSLSSTQANFNGNFPYGGAAKGPYLGRPAKVGSYSPNAFGLYDMHGNVQEWCADWYDPSYYSRGSGEDPKGPTAGVVRTGFESDYFLVVRGGSWLDEARGCRSAYRFRFMPSDRYRLVGFRVVCPDGAGKSQ